MRKRRPVSHFNRFKKAFKYWQNQFGLVEYSVIFGFDDMPDLYARLCRSADGKTARAALTTQLFDGETDTTPEDTALHEAIHLLLARYAMLANDRYTREDSLGEAEEEIVRTLEHVISQLHNSAKMSSRRAVG